MPSANGRQLRFTRIAAENWRNFGKIDVPLQRRVFIVGPNASGKSNFLDIFRFLQEIVSVGRGFEQAVTGVRGGVSSIRSLAARKYPDIAVQVQLGTDEQLARWTYELKFSQDNNQRPIIKKERVLDFERAVLERPNEQDRADPERLTQTYLQQVNVNREFRDIAEFLSSIRYRHIVPQLVRDQERSKGQKDDPYGGDFLEQVARTTERVRTARLGKIRDALRVAVPQLTELELHRDEASGSPHLRGRYEHWRPHGAWQNEKQFSDGTIRLMGLLWAILDGAGPLLLEEPELSLHQEVVRFLPQMFARIQRQTGRQIIVTTHSSDLLREGVAMDEVLLLAPTPDGTSVRTAAQLTDVRELLEGGLNLADTVMPRTRPTHADQLIFFGEPE
jgi:predicted ATPase